MKGKVVVGLSGGVDSAVSVIRLLEQGYEVEGMFMRNWDSSLNNDVLGNPNDLNDVCPQEKDYMDALTTANELGPNLCVLPIVDRHVHKGLCHQNLPNQMHLLGNVPAPNP